MRSGLAKAACALEYPTERMPIAGSRALESMIGAAEAFARDFDYVRVDFHEVSFQPPFGGEELAPPGPAWIGSARSNSTGGFEWAGAGAFAKLVTAQTDGEWT